MNHLKQGSAKKKNNVVATAWKDKKIVHFVTTQSHLVGDETVNHKQCHDTVIQVLTVPVAKSYNKSTGGVDHHDHHVLCYWNKVKKMVAQSFLVLCQCEHY